MRRGIGETDVPDGRSGTGEFAAGGFTLTRVPPGSIVARREMTVAMSTRDGQIAGTVTYDGGCSKPVDATDRRDFVAADGVTRRRRLGRGGPMDSVKNADFEHTGPGRPAGYLLRQCWQPVYRRRTCHPARRYR